MKTQDVTNQIVTIDDPRIRERANELSPAMIKSPACQEFSATLIEAMLRYDGIGIAAPQIGKPWRMFAVRTKDGNHVFINPVIKKKSWQQEWGEEGCLSVPGIFGMVKRHKTVTMEAFDENGQPLVIQAKGFFARVLQHETDHLDGILFVDKAKNLTENQNNGIAV